MSSDLETATFAGGCFWCTEALFKRLRGVEKVVSGYSGGDVENPSYEDVSSDTTGHAESIQITYNPKTISYKDLLHVFFKTHDPTTLNKQGNDVGRQYRSTIFYHTGDQKKQAEQAKWELANSKYYPDKIVTEISHFRNFYPAEKDHQNYYENNKSKPYCKLVIDQKINKLKKDFEKCLK